MKKRIISFVLIAMLIVTAFSISISATTPSPIEVDITLGASYMNQGDTWWYDTDIEGINFASFGGTDPWMEFYGIKDNQSAYPGSTFFSAANYSTLVLIVATDRADEYNGELFFKTNNSDYRAEQSIPLDYANTESKQAFIVDMSNISAWTDYIVGIRLDPFAPASGVTSIGPTNANNCDDFYHVYGLAFYANADMAKSWAIASGAEYINGSVAEDTVITDFDYTVSSEFKTPVAGEYSSLDTDVLAEGAAEKNFTPFVAYWADADGMPLEDNVQYTDNTAYYLVLSFVANPGFVFDNSNLDNYKFNGKTPFDGEIIEYEGENLILVLLYDYTIGTPVQDEVITEFDLTLSNNDFPAPVAGKTTNRDTDVLNSMTDGYSFYVDLELDYPAWYNVSDEIYLELTDSEDVFDENTEHMLYICLIPDAGYAFSEDNFEDYKLNGQAPAEAYIYADGSIGLYYDYGTTGDIVTTVETTNVTTAPDTTTIIDDITTIPEDSTTTDSAVTTEGGANNPSTGSVNIMAYGFTAIMSICAISTVIYISKKKKCN